MIRTNIAVEGEVAASLSDEAARENKTLYAFANESLKAVLHVCQDGGKVDQIYSSWFFARIMHDIDSVPIPGSLLEKIVKALYASDQGSLMSYWFEEGERIGAYLHLTSPDIVGLSDEARELSQANLLPVKRVDIRGEGEGKIAVRVVGAGISTESTKCAEHFIRGLLSAYSYRVTESNVTEGIIELRASR